MKKTYGVLLKVNTVFQKAEQFIGCCCLAVLFVIMISNAALRYLFNSGINWSDEINGFLFIWFGFLAASYAMSTNSHLNISAIVGYLPRALRNAVRAVTDITTVVMFIIYLPPLLKLMNTLPTSNVTRFPLKYVYIVLPVCFLLMCWHIVFNIFSDIYSFFNSRKQEEKT